MRLFLSLKLSDGILDELVALQARFKPYGVMRCPVRENLHLTLKFLGEAELEPVTKVLEQVSFQPFPLELSSIGTFGDRILWVGFKESRELMELKQKIDRCLPGFPDDHPFTSHVTLARIERLQDKKGFHDEIMRTKLPSHVMTVEAFLLMKSDLQQGGPVYGEIARFASRR